MDTVQRVAPPVPVRWACLVLMVFPGLLACMGDAPPEGARVSAAGTVLVTLREGTNMSLALSPDRRTLALDIQGTLWTLPVEGGTANAITDYLGDVRQPSWSPDGQRIVFQSYRDGGWHLWTVRRDGTGLSQLTTGPHDHREPQWSADGRRIVFSSD